MATTGSRRGPTQPPRRPSGGSGGSGRGRPRKRQNPILHRIKRFFQWSLVIGLSCVVGVIASVIYVLWRMPTEVPDLDSYNPAQRTLIYATNGELLAKLYPDNRQVVSIDDIPTIMQQATIAVEDRRFYSNVGIDFRGIGRAVWRDVRGGRREEGASTITQQLVKNMHIGGVGSEKTIFRKIKEALYAVQIERLYSKQQILSFYLNQVYYGSGAWGIQAASETYFNEPASKLTMPQAALLAGLPNSPTYDSPYQYPDHALARRNIVLHTMLESHYITQQQYDDTKQLPIDLAFKKSPQGRSRIYHAPFFVDYVVKELSTRLGADFIQRGGVKVYTTLNLQMQAEADKDLDQGIANAHWYGATQGALVAMDPATGYVKAMVGGVDYNKSQFNIAADGRRQPGSSFKPIIYTAAMDSGLITENTPILDSPVSFPSGSGGTWSPKNDDHYFRGWVTAKRAVADSINIPAIKVLERVTPQSAIQYARIMGVNSPLQPYLTLALGADAVTPLEMATVYSVIANGGNRPTPTGIRMITDEKDNVLPGFDGEPHVTTTSIQKSALDQMGDMLRAVVTQGTAAASFRDDNPPDAHGKTGTTQSHLDVWFDGYAQGLVCTVWAGNPYVDPHTKRAMYGHPMGSGAFGATITTPIWKKFMVAALPIARAEEAKEKAQRDALHPAPPPPDTGANQNATTGTQGSDTDNQDDDSGGITPVAEMVPVWIDNSTGKRVPPISPDAHVEKYARGQEPAFPKVAPPPADTDDSDPNAIVALPTVSQTKSTVTVVICTESGQRASQWCPETEQKTYPLGTEPKQVCTIHKPPDLAH